VAQSTVELIVDAAKAINPLRRVTVETKKLEGAVSKAQNSIQKTSKGIRNTGKAADKASKGVNKLGKAVRGLVAGFGIFQAGKFVIFKTAELERQTKSLEVLTGSLGNARSIIKELQQFGAVTPFTSAELVETAKRLKAFGFETEQIVDVTKRLADVAGATGADLGGIATAFGQIQAKGRLQGEELLQLQERGIGLQDELVKMYGFTADEFRKALEGGRISADAVNVALQNITNAGGKYANGAIAQSETLSGKFSTLVDNITVLAQHIGNALAPALKEILSLTNQILSGFNDILSSQVARGVASAKLAMLTPGGTMGDIAQMRANVAAMPTTTLRDDASIQETARRLTDISTFVRELGAAIETRRPGGTSGEERQALEGLQGLIQSSLGELGQRQLQIRAEDKPKVVEPPKLLTRTKTNTGTDLIATQQQKFDALLLKKKQEGLLAAATTKEERGQLELVMAKFELNRQFPDLKESELQKLRDQLQTNFDLGKAEQKRVADTKAANDAKEEALKRQQAEAQRLEQLFGGIGQTISTGIVDTLMQAKSASEALSGVLNDVARQLLQLGVNSLLQVAFPGSSLFSALPGFANGGRPAVGRPSVVGERGPELFVPDRAGTILPNGVGMGGGTTITVNVDASETSADASSGQGAQLGKAIGLAVQQELIKQKRPGGLIAAI